jgi:hypothetical protein
MSSSRMLRLFEEQQCGESYGERGAIAIGLEARLGQECNNNIRFRQVREERCFSNHESAVRSELISSPRLFLLNSLFEHSLQTISDRSSGSACQRMRRLHIARAECADNSIVRRNYGEWRSWELAFE